MGIAENRPWGAVEGWAAAPTINANLSRGRVWPYRADKRPSLLPPRYPRHSTGGIISGKNTIRFEDACQDGQRIQLDLPTAIERGRDSPWSDAAQDVGVIRAQFSLISPGLFMQAGLFDSISIIPAIRSKAAASGGVTFKTGPVKEPFLGSIRPAKNSARAQCGDPTRKYQWRETELQKIDISVAIPNGLVDVLNGKFMGQRILAMVTRSGTGRRLSD